jgi:hypothetical protein
MIYFLRFDSQEPTSLLSVEESTKSISISTFSLSQTIA